MIPNILHFIYLKNPESVGNKDFGLTHFLSIKSAIIVNKPTTAFLHYNEDQAGEFWQMAKALCQGVQVELPSQIFGIPIKHIAHAADILKYQILLETGGIYLDTDIIHKRSMAPLLKHKFVLGRQGFDGFEGVNGFCNAVILSEPKAEFLQKWLEGYDPLRSILPFVGFRSAGYDEFYSEMSSEYPDFLASLLNPEIIHIEPNSSFFYPMYDQNGLKMLFEQNHDFPAAFCHHFWESAAKEYLEKITVDQIRTVDTTYNCLARVYLD